MNIEEIESGNKRPDPLPYAELARVRDNCGTLYYRKIIKVITKLDDECQRLQDTIAILMRKPEPIKAKIICADVSANEKPIYLIKLKCGNHFDVNMTSLASRRKTALRQARRVIDRINKRGIEVGT